MALLGAHESVAGGLYKAFDRIKKVGGESLQIFTRNQRQWNPAPLTQEEIDLYKRAHVKSGAIPVASHASYLVNLATAKKELLEKSINSMVLELERCDQLGIPFVVMHPGSHGGDGEQAGLERVVAGIDSCFARISTGVKLLVETTAGQGTGLGRTFAELGYILKNSKFPQCLGVCVDTCHIFAAGYEIRTEEGYQNTMDELDREVGLENVHFFHVNDSKKELGSRVDRHEHIGRGEIGVAGFANLLSDPRFASIPMTLETPKSESLAEDIENLATLRSLT
ncbi:deoxyribonuclease IV [Desulforhopalus singaporensis]|uniref:Probable endonuclease 4 n=1 Tax=Desulforhopalus singaporensis TaxID=91360 RepID=A0A1H0S9Q6_9BACT|nr:deoxyribonuclease IV [Desulforhopalus singaporensis]SDP37948.1 Endonuclease IV [Desulforhopalus singaporensis]